MICKMGRLVRGATVFALGLGPGSQSVQAQTYAIVSGHVALASGTCAVEPAPALSSSNTNAAVSASNPATVIDLTPGATVTTATTRHGVNMINGGMVLLGPNTPISVNASTTGLLGISINNSVISGSLGTGIPIIMNNVTAGTNVSGYGLRAIQNSSVTLGLNLTSNFSKSAYGVRAESGSTVNLINASSVVLSGPDAAPGGAALIAVDPGSVIDARDGTIISNTGHDVTGIYMSGGGLVRAYGLAVLTGGELKATNSAIRTEGAGSYGLFSGTTSATRQNNVSIAGGSLASTQSSAIQVSGSQLNLSLSDSVQVDGGNGTLSQVTGARSRTGTLNLFANSARLTGAALTDAGSTANTTLLNNTLWNMTGSSNVTSLVNDFSTIVFGPPNGSPTLPSNYKTLTAGNYAGSGGTIGLNTFLGGDGSPSDRLIIDGETATGLTGLRITHAGGQGAVTLGNGIQVVDTINGGSTTAGAFALSNRVVEGPYEYQLSRSSIDSGNPQGWHDLPAATGPTTVRRAAELRGGPAADRPAAVPPRGWHLPRQPAPGWQHVRAQLERSPGRASMGRDSKFRQPRRPASLRLAARSGQERRDHQSGRKLRCGHQQHPHTGRGRRCPLVGGRGPGSAASGRHAWLRQRAQRYDGRGQRRAGQGRNALLEHRRLRHVVPERRKQAWLGYRRLGHLRLVQEQCASRHPARSPLQLEGPGALWRNRLFDAHSTGQ